MRSRLMSQLLAKLAQALDFKIEAGRSAPPAGERDAGRGLCFALSAKVHGCTYVVTAATEVPGRWSVYNAVVGRDVATGLPRNQAVTLARILNFDRCKRPGAGPSPFETTRTVGK